MNEPPPLEPVLDFFEVDYDDAKGGNQLVLCPAHEETTPSCSVNLDKGLIRCFACDLAGSAVDLIMRKEGCDLATAFGRAKSLAANSGREVRPGATGRMAIGQGNTGSGRSFRQAWHSSRSRADT